METRRTDDVRELEDAGEVGEPRGFTSSKRWDVMRGSGEPKQGIETSFDRVDRYKHLRGIAKPSLLAAIEPRMRTCAGKSRNVSAAMPVPGEVCATGRGEYTVVVAGAERNRRMGPLPIFFAV